VIRLGLSLFHFNSFFAGLACTLREGTLNPKTAPEGLALQDFSGREYKRGTDFAG
jgi:hypothetical protein